MIRVSVRFQGVERFVGSFADLEQAQAWVTACEAHGMWGPQAIWTRLETEAPEGAETRQVPDGLTLETVTEYKMGDAYEVITTDVTAEREEAAGIQRRVEAQRYGARVIALVGLINEEKNLQVADLIALMNDDHLLTVERLLRDGALQSGRDLLIAQPPAAYTSADVARVVAFINASGMIE